MTPTAVVEARPLRGLTLWQPWATAIAHLGKRTENRPRRTNYRGWILIHAGLGVDTAALSEVGQGLPMPRSAVLAAARITDAHRQCDGTCGRWAEPGAVHWQLADVLALTRPVRATGSQWLWVPDDDLRQRIADALPHAAPADLTSALRSPAGRGSR